jgi:putative spermidine/putrescine transport system permease protein
MSSTVDVPRTRMSLRAKERLLPGLLLGPALLVLVTLFAWPVWNTFVLSVSGDDAAAGPTLANYKDFFSDSYNVTVLFRTVVISAIAAVLTLVLAFPVATHMVRARGKVRVLIALVALSPLLVSVIVRTFGWLVVLGPDGLLSRVSTLLGLEPMSLMFTETAVVIGLVHVLFPFMVLSLLSGLSGADDDLLRAAQNLGATRTRAFLRITLPLSVPGILAGSLLVFTLSTGSFVTPALLGGNPSMVLSMLTFQQSLVLFNGPAGATIAIILLATVLLSTVIYRRLLRALPSQSGHTSGGLL